MKGRGWAALALALVGLYAFFRFGGKASGPSNLPEAKTPGANEAASGLQSFFDNLAETFTGWTDATWRVIALLGLVGLGIWIFKKVPMVVWLVMAVVAVIVAVQV